MQRHEAKVLEFGSRGIFFFRRGAMRAAARRGVSGVLALAMLGMSTGIVWAQQDVPPPPDYDNGQGYPDDGPPPQPYQALAPEQLDDLVAPIALYPDSLVAQILAASTYPQQVVSAEEFEQQSGNYPPSELAEMANQQPWDPSVKSLVAFPQVLRDLNQNMTWTTDLGNAYYNQPQDVMTAVQSMRQRAYAAGNLRSGSQLSVVYEPGDIVIAPVSPEVIYVPYYNPWVVYGAPIPVYADYHWGPPRGVVFGAGVAIGFGVGLAIGAFTHYGWGCHHWEPNWGSRTVVYNNTTYISNSTTVINHGYYGRFDRRPGAVQYNRIQAARFRNNQADNHLTVNRNEYNRGAQTVNRGQLNINRGPQTVNRAPLTVNRGPQIVNRSAQNDNRGAQTFNRNDYNRAPQNVDRNNYIHGPQTVDRNSYNRAPQTVDRSPQTFNRNIYNRGAQTYNQGSNFNRGAYNTRPPYQQSPQENRGGFNTRPSYQPNPPENRGAYNTRPPQNFSRPQEPSRPPQNFSRPQESSRPQNFSRPPAPSRPPQNFSRPPEQSRPQPQPRPESRPSGDHGRR